MLTAPDTKSASLRGLAWVDTFLITTTIIVFFASVVFESDIPFVLLIRWMRIVLPFGSVQPRVPELLGVGLTDA
jgi:hypothetical protein